VRKQLPVTRDPRMMSCIVSGEEEDGGRGGLVIAAGWGRLVVVRLW
jgi:hypothetical protein